MIAKITHGSDFGGLLHYLLEGREGAEILGGNMSGRDRKELTREFETSANLGVLRARTRVVQHVSLSMQPGEVVAKEKMLVIAARYLQLMGFDLKQHQYVVIRHRDCPHEHCHLAISRRRLDDEGLTPIPHLEYRLNVKACRTIETEMGLRPLPPNRGTPKRSPRFRNRNGGWVHRSPLASRRIRGAVRWAARRSPTMSDFLDRLQRRRVFVRPVATATGEVVGISYRYGTLAIRGKTLGPECTWRGLQRHLGVRYEPVRDLGAVRSAAARAESLGPTPYMARHAGQSLRTADEMCARDIKRRRRRESRKAGRQHPASAAPTRRALARSIPIPAALARAGGGVLSDLFGRAIRHIDPDETEESARSRS